MSEDKQDKPLTDNVDESLDSKQQGTTDEGASSQQKDQTIDGKVFTQDEIDAIITKRLEREREKAAKEAEAAKQKAEEMVLEKQQEWEKLAKQREAKLAELNAQTEQSAESLKAVEENYSTLETAVSTFVEAQLSRVPEPTRQLLDKLPLVDRLEWLASNAESIKKQVHAIPETPSAQLPDKATLDNLRKGNALNYQRQF